MCVGGVERECVCVRVCASTHSCLCVHMLTYVGGGVCAYGVGVCVCVCVCVHMVCVRMVCVYLICVCVRTYDVCARAYGVCVHSRLSGGGSGGIQCLFEEEEI